MPTNRYYLAQFTTDGFYVVVGRSFSGRTEDRARAIREAKAGLRVILARGGLIAGDRIPEPYAIVDDSGRRYGGVVDIG